jgi:hypothetical protein
LGRVERARILARECTNSAEADGSG